MKVQLFFAWLGFGALACAQPQSSDAAVKPPVLDWKMKTTKPIIASPVAVQSTVYVGGLDSILYALDLETGRVRWTFRSRGAVRAAVAVRRGVVYLNGGDGTVYALAAADGKLVWRHQTGVATMGERLYDWADYFQAAPVLDENNLYIGLGNGHVYALRHDSGEPVWTFATGDVVHGTPALADGRLFVGSFDGHLYSLDAQSGRLHWKFKTVGSTYFPRGEINGSPVAAKGRVYVGSRDYNLYALDARLGYCHWNRRYPAGWALALTATDSVLYVGTSDDRTFEALDALQGSVRWATSTQFNTFGAGALANGLVYFGTLMGKIRAVDAKTGQVRWILTTDGYQAHRTRYLKPDDSFRDDISSLLKTPADMLDLYYRLGAVFSTPLPVGGRLLVTSTDGTVYAWKVQK